MKNNPNVKRFSVSMMVFAVIMITGLGFTALAEDAYPVDKKYVPQITDPTKQVQFSLHYPGGDMLSADMNFYNNGLMVLNSMIYSVPKSDYYFLWEYNAHQTGIIIKFIDKRINFSRALSVEKSHGVTEYSFWKKTIEYRFDPLMKGGINFQGWGFSK